MAGLGSRKSRQFSCKTFVTTGGRDRQNALYKKNTSQAIELNSDNDIPIFATARDKIEFSRFSPHYADETEMMDSRWNLIRLKHQFPKEEQVLMDPCSRCFIELISCRKSGDASGDASGN